MKGINAGTQRQQKSYMPFEQNSSHIYMGQKQKQNSNALFSKKDMRDIRRSVQTSWSDLQGLFRENRKYTELWRIVKSAAAAGKGYLLKPEEIKISV